MVERHTTERRCDVEISFKEPRKQKISEFWGEYFFSQQQKKQMKFFDYVEFNNLFFGSLTFGLAWWIYFNVVSTLFLFLSRSNALLLAHEKKFFLFQSQVEKKKNFVFFFITYLLIRNFFLIPLKRIKTERKTYVL